jgi:7-keto-8-aminopelargonate synthetase-like enzyme
MSKTLGALGGFVAGPERVVELLRNRARSFIFTTAATPADTAAALAAVRLLQTSAGQGLVDRLRRLVERVRPGHPSPIIPVVLGSERRAVEAATELLARGLLVPAIRPPTVPVGSSRLRITLSAAHQDEHVELLLAALDDLGLLAAARGEAVASS